jgi:hypothetical protein
LQCTSLGCCPAFSFIACCPASPVTVKHMLHIIQPFLLTFLTHLLKTEPLGRCPALYALWTGSSMLSWLTCSMHNHLLAVLPYLLYGQALLCCPDSPAQCTATCLALSSLWTGSSMLSWLTCSMHSRLLDVLPYLLYGQALLCCPDSPAHCTATCSLSWLILFMDRLFYAVLTHLLNAQPLAGCPALSSLWTGSSMLSWLTCSMDSRLLAVLPHLLYGQALLCCPDSPAHCTATCWLSCLIFFMDRLVYYRLS